MKFQIFLLVPVAEETGLKLALSDAPKTGFLAAEPIYFYGFNSFLAKGDLSSTDNLASSLDPYQDRQNVGPDLDPNHLVL